MLGSWQGELGKRWAIGFRRQPRAQAKRSAPPLEVRMAGYEQGSSLAEAHIELTGSAWAADDFLLVCAWLVWESERPARSFKDEHGAAFVQAFEEAYRLYRG